MPVNGRSRGVFVSEVRHAPYVHDQHHRDHGVRSASSWCVVTTADGVMRTTTMGGGPQATAGARRGCEAASYVIAQPRPIASSAVAAGREGTHNQSPGSITAGEWFRPAGGAGRNQDAALSPLLAVTNVPVMLARLIAQRRGVEASGGSFAVSRRGTSVGICAPTSACPLESVIDCSPRALAGPGASAR